jgi:hypothetical protein
MRKMLPWPDTIKNKRMKDKMQKPFSYAAQSQLAFAREVY